MRRDDEARNKPSSSWPMFCFSFCSDARSVMLIWKDRKYSHTNWVMKKEPWLFLWRKHHFISECNTLPLRGFPLSSAACSFHECFLLFPVPGDMWHHSSVTCRSVNGTEIPWKQSHFYRPITQASSHKTTGRQVSWPMWWWQTLKPK